VFEDIRFKLRGISNKVIERRKRMPVTFIPEPGVKLINSDEVTVIEPDTSTQEQVSGPKVRGGGAEGAPQNNEQGQTVPRELDEDEQEQAHLLKIMLGTSQHYFGDFKQLFQGVNDPRNPKLITYPVEALLFTGTLMFLCHLKARRQVNHKLRGNGPSKAKIEALFEVAEVPHGDTLNYGYKKLEVAEMQEVVCRAVETLIRKKVLYRWRLLNKYYLVVIDGTGTLSFKEKHCEHCLTQKLRDGSTLYYHPVLEAKLVTANGFALSLMTEFIENSDPAASKQDCELKAFYRLEQRLKARFARLPICLLLDGLFAGGPTFERCEKNGWKYFIVLTDDDLVSVQKKFEALSRLAPENQKEIKFGQKKAIKQHYRWVNEIAYVDAERKEHQLSVLECVEEKRDSQGQTSRTKFKWLTNFEVTVRTADLLANEGARLRWKIENEGFKEQKRGGFELEHAYSEDATAGKIFYLLMQTAHLIFQLAEKGSLFRKAFPKGVGSLHNIGFRLLEAWRNLRLSSRGFMSLFGGRYQIRFASP
jgi:hypothetical protein